MQLFLFFFFFFISSSCSAATSVTPPLPLLPIPSHRQIQFQKRGISIFHHFGINTFTDKERGNGSEDPIAFNPSKLNATQWMEAAKAVGATLVILTAKHHDGFCLWPSQYTLHSVQSSLNWKSGTGDVVAEFVSAAREAKLEIGFYLSPWDMHESTYGDTLKYNEFYLAQMRELLTQYGPVSEWWLDGAKGQDAPDMYYMFDQWFDVIHQLQPNANIFSDGGPDIRWVGDENGEAGTTSWAMVNKSSITIGAANTEYLQNGDLYGVDWVPPECDVSLRPGWFWHANESVKSIQQMLQLYYKSVGRNCLLLLNVPPNTSGLIEDSDLQALHSFGAAITSIFSINLVRSASVTASSERGLGFEAYRIIDGDLDTYWAPSAGIHRGYLQLDLGTSQPFNLIEIQEPIYMGQRVTEFRVEAWNGSDFECISKGTSIGYRKLELVKTVESQIVRLYIHSSRADPLISNFGLHFDSFTTLESASVVPNITFISSVVT